MGTVALEGIEFFAHHGYYDEERKIGNKYSVDIVVEADLDQAAETDALAATVDYEKLYQLIRLEMEQPSRLLEHVARRISQKTLANFPAATSVEVTIAKFNPPIGGVCNRARVTVKTERTS